MPAEAPARAGLYGSSAGGSAIRTSLAEFIGTFLLVLVGTSVATTSILNRNTYSAGFVGLSFGLALTALVAGLGHVSGCHVNPAVTVGLAVTRNFPWRYVPAYLAAQFGGAALASLVVWAAYGDNARSGAHLGAAVPAPSVGVGSARWSRPSSPFYWCSSCARSRLMSGYLPPRLRWRPGSLWPPLCMWVSR